MKTGTLYIVCIVALITDRMHLKPEPAAGASTRLRPISATRQMPIGHIFSLVLLILIGLLCVGAGHAPEMYRTGRELPDEE